MSISYSDPRLVAVYDALNPPAADTTFYLDLAGRDAKTILDMGCGTGLLACELARRGHRVTGADPAPAMLDHARRRSGGDGVDWLPSGAAQVTLGVRFDLIVMTGHVFQVFLDDADIRAALGNLCGHLAPGGRIAFETRNPAVRPWTDWVPDRSRRTVAVPGLGPVDCHTRVTSVRDQIVTFDLHFGFADGAGVVAPSRLRFIPQAALAVILAETGFGNIEWFGDWDRTAWGPASREIIVIATRL